MKIRFPWKRFWCPPDGTFGIDEWGYLTDPEGEYGKSLNPKVVSFENIRDTPCLILLGEPGIGKSQAIEEEIEYLREKITQKDELLLQIDLKKYGSEEHLWKDLFEPEIWKEYTNGIKKLHLFIDSLDEGYLHILNITSLILRGLMSSPIEHLSLRITCRTAEWPKSFEDELSQLWGKEKVRIYELAPLRLIDVKNAANLLEVSATDFIGAIHAKNAGPLASKPVTLIFLLNLFKKNSSFPDLSQSKGIIVNREVQPQRGQKTDIYVNAVKLDVSPGSAEPLTVVIEVKGCWHDEVLTAMETQLFNRYMKENSLRCGLYLVGWYMCDQWDGQDSRKKKTPNITIDEFTERLKDQAEQLEGTITGNSKVKSFVLNLAL